ncbi:MULTISPECIES: DEAD/DEAH box helicase [Micrococcus]|uniref:DEAD/DEAH box helicase n=1 Tax=Micrococcus TaxID=1269 RepID=UPI0007638B4A|nr:MULTISPECIES: DEAD/DEAH box helicase [Micrococcus]KWW40848.1 ATP-dependent RNA helicase DeaD [Micrococcus luteus]KZE71285.1 cold-shock protein [Micrococcus aloeverae]MBU8742233.1 DEAD/DEAH box helicase [Micrococcus luteus]MCV7740623.1 DEAD/DEAH box helicase [Micrococcus luteus]NHQ57289.1 DEAD/DEAH box helicase [Micrococcus luteus]
MSDILDPQTTAEAAPELAEAQQEATGTVPQVDAAEPAAPEAPAEPAGPTFLDLGLDARVLAAVEELGYTRPSPIQEATIPLLLDGRDVVGLAQTGTGKTGAFALPALSRLAETTDVNGRADTPQVLVLAPTRELALQVADAFDSYAKHLDDVSVLAVYGGSPYGPQLAGLRRGAQVVVGTPGRVIDHLERGSLDLSDLQTLVLDEADEMLRMGFAEEVDRILASTPDTKQTALFSATMPPAIRRISAQYLNAPEEVAVARQSTTSATIRQRYLQVGHQWKFEALSRILETEEHDGVIAFVRTRAGTEELAQKLTRAGFKAVAISGDIAQKQREKTVEDLKAGRVDILVATDVAARGLDVERISHVVNYDIPQDAESYVHRIGRTGRAGRQGDAVLFMTPRERFLLKQIERTTRQQVEEMAVPSVAEVNAARKRRFADGITRTLERASEEELAVFGEIVAAYVDEHEAEPARVAAALGMMAQGGRPLLAREQEIPFGGGRGRKDRDGGREGGRERGTGDGRGSRGPAREPAAGNATYWIAVGHQDRVRPGNIVGALANEVGLPASAIGAIDLRGNHSLVELPADLTSAQLEAAANAEINGRRLGLRKDTGRPTRAERDGEHRGGFRKDRGERGGFRGDRDGGQRGGFRKDRDDRGDRGGFRKDRDDRGSREDRGGFRKDRDDRGFRGDRGGRPGGRKPRWGAQERSDRGARR